MTQKILLAFLICLMPLSASAAVQRFAVLVGNNNGGLSRTPLKYAEKDAENMYRIFRSLGGIPEENLFLVRGKDALVALEAVEAAKRKIQSLKLPQGDEVLFIFYYSGHADPDALQMEASRLPLADLKQKIKSMPANVKVAILDACHSGEFTLLKGGQKGAPFEVMVDDQLKATGEVFISSSTAVEPSQESDTLSSSYFTHFLTAGLRGAADRNKDDNVSLQEAYQYAYDNTVAHSTEGIGPVQHPTFQYSLQGTGDIPLTNLSSRNSALLFPADLTGKFVVYDKASRTLVAEINKEADRAVKLALSEGEYLIKKRTDEVVLEKQFKVAPAETVTVNLNDAARTPYIGGDFKRSLKINYASLPTGGSGDQVTLQKGEVVKIKLLENLSSKTSYMGEKVQMEAAADIYVDNVPVIREGAKAIGEIVEVKQGSDVVVFKKKGYLKLTLRFVEGVNGQLIPLSSSYAKKGKGAKLYNPKFVRGTVFDAFVDVNTTIPKPPTN